MRGYRTGSVYPDAREGRWRVAITDGNGKRLVFRTETHADGDDLADYLTVARRLKRDLRAEYVEWKRIRSMEKSEMTEEEARLDIERLHRKEELRRIKQCRPSTRRRFTILQRDNFTCNYCGAQAPDVRLHVDHVIPLSKGGTDKDDNLVTSCADCNAGKAASNLTNRSQRPLLARGANGGFYVATRYEEREDGQYAARILIDIGDQLEALLHAEYERGFVAGRATEMHSDNY